MNIDYREWPPSAPLAGAILAYWRVAGDGRSVPSPTILPDAYVEIVLNLAGAVTLDGQAFRGYPRRRVRMLRSISTRIPDDARPARGRGQYPTVSCRSPAAAALDLSSRSLAHQRTGTLRAPMFSATRIMTAIPAATANTAARRPCAVATRSSSPASPPVSKFATRTRTARPIAAPTPLAVETMADATPWSLSETPVPAAMNIVVNTTPSPMLSAISPGTRAP